jgi:hypothetical protein
MSPNSAASRAAAASPGLDPQERRRHRRVGISLTGRYMLEDRQEYLCRTIDMSPGGLALRAPVRGAIGQRVVVYLETLGRYEGKIVRHFTDGFALRLAVTGAKRERLANQLTWLINRDTLGIPEGRRHDRIVPRLQTTIVRTDDGREFPARIADVSMSGVGVEMSEKFQIGTLATIGRTSGRVVRLFHGGIAFEFLRMIPPEMFDEDIVL